MLNTITLDEKFFFGGNATFTIESLKTGTHKTFKIKKMEPSERFPNPAFSLFLLIGPDNTRDYCYIGMVNEFNGQIRFTGKSKRNGQSPDVMIFNWFMTHLFGDGQLMNAKVHHIGKCGCCGRALTVPESILCGLGPECRQRMG